MKTKYAERKRALSLLLSLVLLVRLLPMAVLADETTQTVTGDGTPESPTVTITQNTSTDAAGNTLETTTTVTQATTGTDRQSTETSTTEVKTEFTPAGSDGSVELSQSTEESTTVTTQKVDADTGDTVTTAQTSTSTTATDKLSGTTSYDLTANASDTTIRNSKGETVKEYGYEEGTERWTKDSEQQLDATIQFKTDTQAENITVTDGSMEAVTTGDLKRGADDPQYDQTTITQTDRELEITGIKTEITMGDNVTNKGGSLSPVEADKEQLAADGEVVTRISDKDPVADKPEGYDFFWYTGFGYSNHNVYNSENKVDATAYEFALAYDPTGESLKPEDGDAANTEEYLRQLYAAYCVDYTTHAVNGEWYRRDNLEDAGYFTEEEAEHIRTIATHGYWGTKPTSDNSAPTGSLEAIRKELKAAIAQGNPLLSGLTNADVDALTGGEAMTATQMAIWQYGNRETKMNMSASGDEESVKRINAVSAYLASLEESAGNTTDVLSEKNYVNSVTLSVGERAEEHINNYDDNDRNDAYNTDISFALAVTVDPESDDLVVSVIGADSKVIKTVRIAGKNQQGEDTQFLTPNADGSYTIENVVLIEGENSFNLELTGAQYLEKGVYIYSADPVNETSQTLVGFGEGYQSVDLNVAVTFAFDVTEGKQTGVRIWRQEYYSDPAVDSDDTAEEFNEQLKYRQYDGDNPKTGDHSHIQLWLGMMAASSLTLAALLLSRKKDRTA